ncbi:MAG TPA: hypothetical protein VMZ69_01665, partial [Saprospiraceae bacterium]|nr:hypothetical protein [Saprospiraceae bacterium]
IELIGEWNDCITNDVMILRREITDLLQDQGISKFILIVENVLNYHASDDNSYFEEWQDEVSDMDGWVAIVNPLKHVDEEMSKFGLTQYVHLLTGANWRGHKPRALLKWVEQHLSSPKVLPLG